MTRSLPICTRRLVTGMVAATMLAGVALPAAAQDFDATPGPVSATPGGNVLLQVTVEHPGGPEAIAMVAAELTGGDVHASFPALFDDGTHGDLVAGDGIYTLDAALPDSASTHLVTYYAVDSSGVEIVTDPTAIAFQ